MIDHIWITHFPKITYARHKKLAAHFLTSHSFAQAEMDDLCAAGIEPEIAHEMIVWREKNPWEKIKEKLESAGVRAIAIDDPDYPPLLKQITDPPWVLFVRGNLRCPNEQMAVGVVGTRRHSIYGKEVCVKISTELAKRNIAIISGLALGIDSYAHQAALDQGGYTVAVLGCGIDRSTVYPRSHENLSERIIKSGGALVSEYPPGTPPSAFSFPARNRIIAGLSQGTLVIEAPIQSGALITARRALDYNREVMAIPHPINSESGTGGNDLIKKGAALVTSVDDICETLSWQTITPVKNTNPASNTEESLILSLLTGEARQLESIIQESGLSSDRLLVSLTLLEMRGAVKNLGGGFYAKN